MSAAAKLRSDQVITSLGFRLPPAVEFGRLAEADMVIWGVYGAEQSSLLDSSVYQALPVSVEGRSLYLPERSVANGVMTFSSVLSLPQALEELVPRFAAVVDGDPATEPEPVT